MGQGEAKFEVKLLSKNNLNKEINCTDWKRSRGKDKLKKKKKDASHSWALALSNVAKGTGKAVKRGDPPAPVCPRKCWVLAPELHSQQATVLSKEPVTSFCSSNFTAAQVCVWMP